MRTVSVATLLLVLGLAGCSTLRTPKVNPQDICVVDVRLVEVVSEILGVDLVETAKALCELQQQQAEEEKEEAAVVDIAPQEEEYRPYTFRI